MSFLTTYSNMHYEFMVAAHEQALNILRAAPMDNKTSENMSGVLRDLSDIIDQYHVAGAKTDSLCNSAAYNLLSELSLLIITSQAVEDDKDVAIMCAVNCIAFRVCAALHTAPNKKLYYLGRSDEWAYRLSRELERKVVNEIHSGTSEQGG